MYYYYDNYNDIYHAILDRDNVDLYPNHSSSINWDNLKEITIDVTCRAFKISKSTVKYMSSFASRTVERRPCEYVDRVSEYARLFSGLIDYKYVVDLYRDN